MININKRLLHHGVLAYTTTGLDTIFVNRLGLLKNFIKIHDHTKPSNETEMLNEQQMESIVGAVNTITHELVHLNENSACQTHDPIFYGQLANLLEQMFIHKDAPEKSVLNMLGF
jgi:hypothetical protein